MEPPLYIAGQADVSVKLAAPIGDAWLIVNTSGLGKVKPLIQTYRAALKEYGRTPMEFPITAECYVGSRHATTHEECRGPLEYKYSAYATSGLQDRTTQGTFEEFARDRFIIGDKVSVKEEIARYRELFGRRPLYHALPMAGASAGAGAELGPAAWRDFRVVGAFLGLLP